MEIREGFRRLWQDKAAVIGASIVGLLIFFAIASPLVAPYNPLEMNPSSAFQSPNWQHLLGTDEYGRDLCSRIIFGSRIALLVGIVSVSFSLVVGTTLGMLSGYYLGIIDTILSRAMDVLFAFPPILLALVLITILGTGIEKVMIAIGCVYAPLFFRLSRASELVECGKTYVEAARAVGASSYRILIKHILPNVMAPIIVQASLCMAYAILAETMLSYLGLGTQPPTPSWGMMLSKGRGLMYHSIWVSVWPGVAIMSVVLGLNLLGDGLRDVLDPRLKGR